MGQLMLSVPIIDGFTDFVFDVGELVCFRHEPCRPYSVTARFLKKGETGVFFPVYNVMCDCSEERFVTEKVLDRFVNKGGK